jgi:hypothetical protein
MLDLWAIHSERAVIFCLGNLLGTKAPGLIAQRARTG